MTGEQVDFEELAFHRPEALELWASGLAELSPHAAARLRLQACLWLTRAQEELHDAIFARDGSDESLTRYASARAELDSAEAWALRVADALKPAASSDAGRRAAQMEKSPTKTCAIRTSAQTASPSSTPRASNSERGTSTATSSPVGSLSSTFT